MPCRAAACGGGSQNPGVRRSHEFAGNNREIAPRGLSFLVCLITRPSEKIKSVGEGQSEFVNKWRTL